CIAYASYKIRNKTPEAKVIVTPSDHLILNEALFKARILDALKSAELSNNLVTIGIKPNSPKTGYGYIQFIDGSAEVVKIVNSILVQSDEELAKTFIEVGDFVWNSGIVVWKNQSIIRACELHLPALAEVFE